eukprot:7590-Eustigmatos_ZCMA.PRE.1
MGGGALSGGQGGCAGGTETIGSEPPRISAAVVACRRTHPHDGAPHDTRSERLSDEAVGDEN